MYFSLKSHNGERLVIHYSCNLLKKILFNEENIFVDDKRSYDHMT